MSTSQSTNLSAIPVGGEVDREVIFAADIPRDLTHAEVLAIAALEAWADPWSNPPPQSYHVTGRLDPLLYDEVMCTVSSARGSVFDSLDEDVRDLQLYQLEAAQRIREGSVRGAS